MGQWEGLTSSEIGDRWPGLMETIYEEGIDLKRGEDGESWGEMTHRFANTVTAWRPPRPVRRSPWPMAGRSAPTCRH